MLLVAFRAVKRTWTEDRSWVLALNALVFIALLVVVLPLVAIARGFVYVVGSAGDPHTGWYWAGMSMSIMALALGTFFFACSVKYYMGSLLVLISSYLHPRYRNGNGHDRGKAAGKGRLRPIRRNGGAEFHLSREPFVSVHIASYNEKRVIGRLLEACAQFDYTNYEVILVDDSTDATAQIVSEWRDHPGFKIIHRESRQGYKGGALTHALRAMDPRTEFVMVLDADALPFPDTIRSFLPEFFFLNGKDHDPPPRTKVAAVQSYQWHVLNKDTGWLTEAVRTDYSGSYMVERTSQEVLGAMKMIAGTAYMIRAEVLKEMGWGTSLTEDWELTLKLYAAGYKVAYTPYAEVPAECVSTFARLARQRMRWAEGHCFNVRRYFWTIMRSPRVSRGEKAEFLYFAVYYVQPVLFVVGTIFWLVAELVIGVRIPGWTALLGWSLVLSNLLALPFLNMTGLFMEGAPLRDYTGLLGSLVLSYLLVPFQGWAALRGFVEKEEGPWHRTPKTGVRTGGGGNRMKRRSRLSGRLEGLRLPRLAAMLRAPVAIRAEAIRAEAIGAEAPRGRRRLPLVVATLLTLSLAGLYYTGTHISTARAATGQLYLLAGTGPSGPGQSNELLGLSAGNSQRTATILAGAPRGWSTTTFYVAGTLPPTTWTMTLDFSMSNCGDNNNTPCTVNAQVGYLSGCVGNSCSNAAPMGNLTGQITGSDGQQQGQFNGSGNRAGTVILSGNVSGTLSNCPCAIYVIVSTNATAGNNFALNYNDGPGWETHLNISTIPVPEHALPLAGLALLAPFAVARLRRLKGHPA